MGPESFGDIESARPGRRLTGLYVRVLLWFVITAGVLWAVGLESVYGHPAPFYAQYDPIFRGPMLPALVAALGAAAYLFASQRLAGNTAQKPRQQAIAVGAVLLLALAYYQESAALRQPGEFGLAPFLRAISVHAAVLALLVAGLISLDWALRRIAWLDREPAGREFWGLLAGIVVFGFVFVCAIAMLRGGLHGISQAYERTAYEYIGDIGKAPSIRELFARYLELHPYLSMHAKVHPPGPIVLLWLLSLAVTQHPLALSLATAAVGALGVIPLALWAREVTHARCALICALLYAVVPSVVLFTATSADILFIPFTLGTLVLFDRALRRGSLACAAGAGLGYGMMALLKFSLLGVGVYFALAGLWFLLQPALRRNVIPVAAVMAVCAGAVPGGVWLWSGFDYIAAFHAAKAQFDLDQHHLDLLNPRLPAWSYRLLNPMCWFYFAGIPVSVLFLWRLWKPAPETRALFLVFLLTACALNLLYLARGEGERSALYLIPFLVLPAAHALEAIGSSTRAHTPLLCTLAFLAFQCWLTESYFYTYW